MSAFQRTNPFGIDIVGITSGWATSRTCLILGGLLAGVGTGWAVSTPAHVVSQAGRAFTPAQVAIKRGDIVQVLNDDGDLLHHIFIESDRMSFDSGDQKPGSRTDILFPVAGDFVVLCAIHPKMKLRVRVQ